MNIENRQLSLMLSATVEVDHIYQMPENSFVHNINHISLPHTAMYCTATHYRYGTTRYFLALFLKHSYDVAGLSSFTKRMRCFGVDCILVVRIVLFFIKIYVSRQPYSAHTLDDPQGVLVL